MREEFRIQGHSISVSFSIGISIFPDHGTDATNLMKYADVAMYSAKTSGRNKFSLFTNELSADIMERVNVENALRGALARHELFLMYQPQIDVTTGQITAFEALLRWRHPELGLVPPDRFIRIAENSGQILAFGEWVLRRACAQARKWQTMGLPAVTMAVNVSAVQFRQDDFSDLIKTAIEQSGLPPQCLELELTESLLLSNADSMLSVVQKLRLLGVKLAIDDFGTGYSSFSYLRKLLVQKLKIDKSFIREVTTSPNDAAITIAIIRMAKALNLKVIAEGVENEAQASFLRKYRCDEVQGYFFSKPLSAEEATSKLEEQGAGSQRRRRKPAQRTTTLNSDSLFANASVHPEQSESNGD